MCIICMSGDGGFESCGGTFHGCLLGGRHHVFHTRLLVGGLKIERERVAVDATETCSQPARRQYRQNGQ